MVFRELVDQFPEQGNRFQIGDGFQAVFFKISQVVLDDLVAEGMIGMDVDLVSIWANHFQQALSHGHRTRIGIGHAKDVLGKRVRFHQDFPNPDGQNLRFSSARARNDHYWPFNGIHRLFLSSIEFGVFVLVGGEMGGHGGNDIERGLAFQPTLSLKY